MLINYHKWRDFQLLRYNRQFLYSVIVDLISRGIHLVSQYIKNLERTKRLFIYKLFVCQILRDIYIIIFSSALLHPFGAIILSEEWRGTKARKRSLLPLFSFNDRYKILTTIYSDKPLRSAGILLRTRIAWLAAVKKKMMKNDYKEV